MHLHHRSFLLSRITARVLGAHGVPHSLAALGALVVLGACPTGDPMSTESGTDSTAGETETDTGEIDPSCEGLEVPALDEASCQPLDSDYLPRDGSTEDPWPACVTDGGAYSLIADAPSSLARVEAYEMIAALLWSGTTPSAADFTAARDVYVTPEGLESRLVRREDLHYPPVDMADWDMMVDPDKQCTVEANIEKYPDRCAGPARIGPLIVSAFAAGQTDDGDPAVNAARVEAGLLWFLYLSAYKEANTCATNKAKDCDSAWAYYTGGDDISGGKGLADAVRGISVPSHERIWDGILAVRCWRDLTRDGDMYPLLDELEAADQLLFGQAAEQLDQGLHRGFARVVRARLEKMIAGKCDGTSTAADWAFLQTAGAVLDREATERGVPEAATLKALWALDAPNAQNLADGVLALDAVFPCG